MAIAAAAIYFLGGWTNPVRFVGEEIHVRTDGRSIDVDGIYLYRNDASRPALSRLGIPFPIDHDHPEPFALALDEVDTAGRIMRRLSPAIRGTEVSLRLIFAPRQERRVRVRYSQLTDVDNGRYLLTTTHAWKRPIERARFTLSLAEGLSPSSSNYRLVPLGRRSGWNRFAFERESFWPDRDWEFGWTSSSDIEES